MAYNGAILSRAREALARRREENAAELERRTRGVYARIPRVREIDSLLRRQMARLCALAFSGDGAEVEALRRSNLGLQAERAALLAGAGLPGDYLDEIFSCKICHDTGWTGQGMCECLKREYNACLTRELSGLLRGGESFERFRLDYYSGEYDPALGASPREAMSIVLGSCRAYAENFSLRSPNLLFRGGPGLGKTFLSGCIAREAAAKGFAVAYESAPEALGQFEQQRFSRDPEASARAAAKVREYLGCGLMILDDLGAEAATGFAVSALYQLVNGRLASGRPTIISTNLAEGEIERRYGGQTASRLAGEYELLNFVGSDIRRLRKELGE